MFQELVGASFVQFYFNFKEITVPNAFEACGQSLRILLVGPHCKKKRKKKNC